MTRQHERGILCSILIVMVTGITIASMGENPPPRGISTEAIIDDWYDGDTAYATIQLKVRLRTLDCWCTEVRGVQKPEGLKSKKRAQELVPPGSKVRIFIPTTGRLQDSLTFGRPLAHLWIKQDDGSFLNVGETLVSEGFATKEKVRK